MSLKTEHLANCLATLESSLQRLRTTPKEEKIEYDIFRNATIKGFELSLETAGKLLRKALKLYIADPKQVDSLTFKEVLRQATKYNLLDPETVKRWFEYRDQRNDSAHNYGEALAEKTLILLAQFIKDTKVLEQILSAKFKEQNA